MAISAAYARITQISRTDGSSALQGVLNPLSNAAASNSTTFTIVPGKYMIEAIGTTFGTITLQKLGPDGSTYLTVGTALSANGTQTVDLPAGTYRFAAV